MEVLLVIGVLWFIFAVGGSSGGGSSSSDQFTKVHQRGDYIEAYRGSMCTRFEGRLQGWSSDMISFRRDGQDGAYLSNGSYEFYS